MASTGEQFVRAVYRLRKDQKRRLAQKALDDSTPGGASAVLRNLIDQVMDPAPNPQRETAQEDTSG